MENYSSFQKRILTALKEGAVKMIVLYKRTKNTSSFLGATLQNGLNTMTLSQMDVFEINMLLNDLSITGKDRIPKHGNYINKNIFLEEFIYPQIS